MPETSAKNAGKRTSYHLYLGVDGGGTRTQIVLMNDAKEIVGEGEAGPSNPLRVGVETAVANIVLAVDAAFDAGGFSSGDIQAATLGLAGVRRHDLRERIRDAFIKRLQVRKALVTTDAEIALFGTTLGKPGLVVIAGTGSICLGKNAARETAIAGGWGPLAGDEGGGRGIAERALHSVAKASDGRGISTRLSERALEYFRASSVDNLLVAIYSPQVDNSRIAGFARLVVETAREGDKIAVEILTDAGRELGVAACAVIKKLKLERKTIPIGCVGSIFKAGELLTDRMFAEIHAIAPKAFLAEPLMIPSHAAALMAFESSRMEAEKKTPTIRKS